MPVFAVMLRGENFVIEVDEKPARLGFFTTRWVRAPTPEEAELAAVALVKNDQTLVTRVDRDAAVTPLLYAESIERRPWWQGFRSGSGYSFWCMDSEQSLIASVEEGVRLVDSFKGKAEEFVLAVPDSLLDPVGLNLAVITDRVLARGWQPAGFTQAEGYRIYRYHEAL
jgi:hypothetical protein